jgi:glycerol uptake facilitator-like aquaporin
LLAGGTAFGQGAEQVADTATKVADAAANAVAIPPYWYLAPVGAVLALITAFFFYRSVVSKSEGDENMVRIAQAVREGAYAYHRACRASAVSSA